MEHSDLNWVSFKKNGFKHFDPFDIPAHCQHILYFLWGRFKHVSDIEGVWKSSQLQKKLCHFMIVVLWCVDLNELS